MAHSTGIEELIRRLPSTPYSGFETGFISVSCCAKSCLVCTFTVDVPRICPFDRSLSQQHFYPRSRWSSLFLCAGCFLLLISTEISPVECLPSALASWKPYQHPDHFRLVTYLESLAIYWYPGRSSVGAGRWGLFRITMQFSRSVLIS